MRLPTGFLAGAIVAILALVGGAAQAQTFPTKTITILAGVPPGGSVNAVFIQYAEILGKALGQRVVIENKPGGGGITAALALTQAPPDGHTIMVALGGMHTIVPAMQPLTFHPIDDFEPVSLLYSLPNYIAVPGNSPVNSVKELIEFGKKKPGGLSFGTSGVGSPGHLMGELLAEKTGVAMTHIAYKGGGPMMLDLMAGRLDYGLPPSAIAIQPAKEKQVKLLAIVGDRFPGTPDVPTFEQAGIAGTGVDSLFGVVAPKGTPKAIIARLNEEFSKASRDPELVKKMAALALVIRATPPEALNAAFRADLARLGKVVKDRGIKAQ